MRLLASLAGAALLVLVLTDTFNTIVLPRRTRYGFRVTRVFYRSTYRPYSAIARWIRSGRWRESYLSVYGPLSLLVLIGIWATGVILGFGLILWSGGLTANGQYLSLFDSMYVSATTFSTLGTADPHSLGLKLAIMVEGLLGLGFLGLNIGYLPVLYQSFSRRELRISLLDARAGSPPSASAFIERQAGSEQLLQEQMAQWEQWAADLLENHLSYPMLAYFRSHHENQSWITALVAAVDAAAITVTCAEGDLKTQAGLTFAMGRHALVDIAAVFRAKQPADSEDRLPSEQFQELRRRLAGTPSRLALGPLSEPELKRLRNLYEPSAVSLSRYFLMALPPWVSQHSQDNWSTAGQSNPSPSYTVSDPDNQGS